MAGDTPKKPWIETPLIWSRSLSKAAGCQVYLKLENTQPSGSFKSRGIGNFMQTRLANGNKPTHFFCSSGGNAGLACVHAAVTLGHPATIVVPLSTSDYMISKLRDAGAREVIQVGLSWFEADQHLNNEILPKVRAQGTNAVYVPPFDNADIWAGNATVVEEILRQLPETEKHYPVSKANQTGDVQPDAIICSVGGGGLFCGIMQGLASSSSFETNVVAVETSGADSLAQAVDAGELITLPGITSIATTLGARTVARQAFTYAISNPQRVKTAVLSDAEAVDGCGRFLEDERILVEPSCGVSIAACYTGKLRQILPHLTSDSRAVIVVCGGSGISMQILAQYIEQTDTADPRDSEHRARLYDS